MIEKKVSKKYSKKKSKNTGKKYSKKKSVKNTSKKYNKKKLVKNTDKKISDKLFNKWLIDEINLIMKEHEKYLYVPINMAEVYVKDNNILIVCIDVDEPSSDFYIVKGKYNNKLEVEHITIGNGIVKYIKENYKGYKRKKLLDQLIIDITMRSIIYSIN